MGGVSTKMRKCTYIFVANFLRKEITLTFLREIIVLYFDSIYYLLKIPIDFLKIIYLTVLIRNIIFGWIFCI